MLRPLIWLIALYEVAILLRCIFSWVHTDPNTPVVQFLTRITEPVLAPVRKLLDPWQRKTALDFSPFIVLLVLELVRRRLRLL